MRQKLRQKNLKELLLSFPRERSRFVSVLSRTRLVPVFNRREAISTARRVVKNTCINQTLLLITHAFLEDSAPRLRSRSAPPGALPTLQRASSAASGTQFYDIAHINTRISIMQQTSCRQAGLRAPRHTVPLALRGALAGWAGARAQTKAPEQVPFRRAAATRAAEADAVEVMSAASPATAQMSVADRRKYVLEETRNFLKSDLKKLFDVGEVSRAPAWEGRRVRALRRPKVGVRHSSAPPGSVPSLCRHPSRGSHNRFLELNRRVVMRTCASCIAVTRASLGRARRRANASH